MKRFSVFCVIVAIAACFSQTVYGQNDKEAAKLAREAAQAGKDQDWDKAVESARKAAALDQKYSSSLAAAFQQRAFAAANERRFPEAIADFTEAIKVSPHDVGIYERRAAVEMKINDMDKALADYNEAIKLKPGEIKYYQYRAFILETKGDFKGAMADNEHILKADKKNKDGLDRKTRLETRMKQQAAANAPAAPVPPPKKP
jgi:tetratricopeptide (TPR) repeat protein